MGYIKHHAIVVTSWNDGLIDAAKDRARDIGLQVIGPSTIAINGYQSILICPDGSKEGWAESDIGDEHRATFCKWLDDQRHEDGSSSLAWVEISYGSDDWEAEITNHAWQEPINGGDGDRKEYVSPEPGDDVSDRRGLVQ